jgi:hypothetical protein
VDERPQRDDEHVEDLEPTTEEADDVKGGRGTGGTFTVTFNGQTTSPSANNDPNQRGGWDGNHSETLIQL